MSRIYMPHPGHFICASDCKFFLNTYLTETSVIVSTVGEMLPDERVREIHAQVSGVKLEGKGDARKNDFLKKCGYMEIGYLRKYETMVFKAEKVKRENGWNCCPYSIMVSEELEMEPYNTAEEAAIGHEKLCKKWEDRETYERAINEASRDI